MSLDIEFEELLTGMVNKTCLFRLGGLPAKQADAKHKYALAALPNRNAAEKCIRKKNNNKKQ